MLVIIGMGLLYIPCDAIAKAQILLFEKSGYRWSKYYSTSCRKEFSLIHAIKEKVRDSCTDLRISAWFSLHNAVFYRV